VFADYQPQILKGLISVKSRSHLRVDYPKALEIYQLCPDTSNNEASAFGTIF
jgi:hypothetical protein